MSDEKEVLILTTVCFLVATIGLLYHGYNGMRIPSIINLPVSIGCGALLSYWFD